MTTKEKILKTALNLFNERGVVDTTIRSIAEELAISSGHLTYHFRYKEELIEALYFELTDKIIQKIN